MNIREHIEAGHYPVDGKGRALVPTQARGVCTIIATDNCGCYPVIGTNTTGAVLQWTEAGNFGDSVYRLLPPAPRKVKVTTWGVFSGTTLQSTHHSKEFAERAAADWQVSWKLIPAVVELTGEYEQV